VNLFAIPLLAGWWNTCCYTFLAPCAKLWKAAGFVMSVCPSAHPYGTTLFPLDRFSWKFVCEYFWTIFWRNSSFFKISQEWQVLYVKTNIHFWWYLTYFFIEWEMFQTKVVDKIKTHFVFNNCFLNSCHLWDNVEKYYRARQATDDNTAHVHCMLDD
jgi:hypothetical protein